MEASSVGTMATGTKQISQVLGPAWLLDFTMLRPVLALWAFLNLQTIYFFNFPIFGGPGKPKTLNQQIQGHDCVLNCVLVVLFRSVYKNWYHMLVNEFILASSITQTTFPVLKHFPQYENYNFDRCFVWE
jgi:hypothetical protein